MTTEPLLFALLRRWRRRGIVILNKDGSWEEVAVRRGETEGQAAMRWLDGHPGETLTEVEYEMHEGEE